MQSHSLGGINIARNKREKLVNPFFIIPFLIIVIIFTFFVFNYTVKLHTREPLSSKRLTDFSDQELLDLLKKNGEEDLRFMAGICSEILRRMNELKPLLEKNKEGN